MKKTLDVSRFLRRKNTSPHLPAAQDWVANRLFILSGRDALVDKIRWMTIVASHRRSNMETDSHWRQAVESGLRRCEAEDLAILASRSTPTGGFILHVARRFNLPTVELILPPNHVTLDRWLTDTESSIRSSDEMNCLWISPDLDDCQNPQAMNHPLADAALIAIADFVHAIDIQKGGKVDRLLRHRLSIEDYPIGSVTVDLSHPVLADPLKETATSDAASISNHVVNPVAQELMDLGAVGWYRPSKYDQAQASPMVDVDTSMRTSYGGVLPTPTTSQLRSATRAYSPVFSRAIVKTQSTSLVDGAAIINSEPTLSVHSEISSDWRYLTHCTRSPRGPWPDQSLTGYYDETLTDWHHQKPLDALIRILEQQRLIGTHHLKYSDAQTVSLSQVPLVELLKRRVFRRHLHRWDWEPYGICIHRDWIESRGGRPVIYASDQERESLPLKDLPFFQSIGGTTEDQRWSKELEWRFVGDIRLAEIPATDAFIFVPTKQEAFLVSSISRFPVMIVESCIEPTHLS